MFTETENKKEVIKELIKCLEEEVVFHYICSTCDDEQVSYPIEVEVEMIDSFKQKNYLMVMYACTNCGVVTKFLETNYILGIERDF